MRLKYSKIILCQELITQTRESFGLFLIARAAFLAFTLKQGRRLMPNLLVKRLLILRSMIAIWVLTVNSQSPLWRVFVFKVVLSELPFNIHGGSFRRVAVLTMTTWLPLIVSALYGITAISFAMKNQWAWFVVWASYSSANIGLVLAQKQ